jgi:hypothetical protein
LTGWKMSWSLERSLYAALIAAPFAVALISFKMPPVINDVATRDGYDIIFPQPQVEAEKHPVPQGNVMCTLAA